MKEPYIPPYLNIVCFAPVEHLAQGPFSMSIDLSTYAASPGESWHEGDVFIPFG